MSHDPIDDYLQALIGEALPDATLAAAAQAQAADRPAATAAPMTEAADPTAPAAAGVDVEAVEAVGAIEAVEAANADEALEAVEAVEAANAIEAVQTNAPAASEPAPGAAAPGTADPLLAELDAAFEQARSQYEQGASAARSEAAQADPVLADLDAAFEQARNHYVHSQAGGAGAAQPVDDLLADLDAAFEQARSQYEQGQASGSAANEPASAPGDELEAAFEQARSQYEQGQATAATPAEAAPEAQPAHAGRIPPAPIGPPVLPTRATAQPLWQAAGSSGDGGELRRRPSERVNRWLRLRCDVQPYALELLKVQEVVLPTPLLSLRGTPAHMLGIMNLRGQVVPVMDLGVYLGRQQAEVTTASRIVVLESGGQTLGLQVSAVDDVVNLTDSQIEPPDTARLCRFSNHLFRGMARLGGTPMILLDADALLN